MSGKCYYNPHFTGEETGLYWFKKIVSSHTTNKQAARKLALTQGKAEGEGKSSNIFLPERKKKNKINTQNFN